MIDRIRGKLTYANVVATIALVLAVGGGSFAVAAGQIGVRGSVTTRDIRNGAVIAKKLAPDAVTAGKLGDFVVAETTSDPIAPGDVGTATAICPDDTQVISGGGFPSSFDMALTTSVKFGNNWRVQSKNTTSDPETLVARAYCLTDERSPGS